MRLLQKECGKCLRHPFLWIVCITFGLFQFLSIYTYVGNAGMRKELRQMHVAVTDEETASPEYESAYADYKKTYGGMYDTLDMRKILEQKEKKSGYEPQGAWGMWIVRNYDRLQKRVEQIRKTGEGTYAFYPGSWYKLHSTLYGKLWKKLILQTAVLMILSMLYLMDYERIYKTQDLVLATTTGKKMMEKKILVVDDKIAIAKVLSIYLASDYDCIWLPNGIEGVKWLQEGNIPDLIISDIRMPEMRGDEFLEWIKSNQLFKHIPVVMLSSEDSTTERIRLLQEGAEDYIVKPFNPMELKVRIKKIIE